MLEDREQQLIDISRDCIGLWQGGYIAKNYRGTVKFKKPTWAKWFDGIVIRAEIEGSKVTYDPRELDRAKTDRVFFVDMDSGRYAWGSLLKFKNRDASVSTFDFSTVFNNKVYGLRYIPQEVVAKYRKETSTEPDVIARTEEVKRIMVTGVIARAKHVERIMNNG